MIKELHHVLTNIYVYIIKETKYPKYTNTSLDKIITLQSQN